MSFAKCQDPVCPSAVAICVGRPGVPTPRRHGVHSGALTSASRGAHLPGPFRPHGIPTLRPEDPCLGRGPALPPPSSSQVGCGDRCSLVVLLWLTNNVLKDTLSRFFFGCVSSFFLLFRCELSVPRPRRGCHAAQDRAPSESLGSS